MIKPRKLNPRRNAVRLAAIVLGISWGHSPMTAAGKAGVQERQAPSVQFRDIHPLNPFTRPLRLAEKRETRFDARVIQEAAHRQAAVQFSPPVPFDERGDDCFQRDAV